MRPLVSPCSTPPSPHSARRLTCIRFVPFVVAIALSIVGGCSTNPATGEPELVLMDAADEAEIGAAAHPRIVEAYGGIYGDAQLAAYVEHVVAKIAKVSAQPDLDYRVTVLDSPVVNAFALPGGYVYVTRGLIALANDEAELASVIAHEIGHVNARHVARRQTATVGASIFGALIGTVLGNTAVDRIVAMGTEGLLAGYSREQEREADELAVAYLTGAGYDPYAARDFLDTMNAYAAFQAHLAGTSYDPQQVGWLSSHPATGERISETAAGAARAAQANPASQRGRAAYLEAIDGLFYGRAEALGYVRDRSFIHVPDRYWFTVPDGFYLAAGPGAVWALGPDKTVVKFDAGEVGLDADVVAYLVDDWASDLALRDVRSFEVNGMSAASARTRLQGLNTLIVAIKADEGKVYRFLAGVPPQAGEQYEEPLWTMVRSFRRLTPAEAAATGPLRISIASVDVGSTVDGFAQRMALRLEAEKRFRVINGMGAEATLDSEDRVKLIVEDRPARAPR